MYEAVFLMGSGKVTTKPMIGLLEILVIGAISLILWGRDQQEEVVAPKENESAAMFVDKREDIRAAGGPDVLTINGKELELINRGVSLPDRDAFADDVSAYAAELDVMLAQTANLAPSLIPEGPKKFEFAYPGDARTIGQQMLDMMRWKYPIEIPEEPPAVEHFDF